MPATSKCIVAAALLAAAVFLTHAPAQEPPLYKDPKAALDRRVDDLLSRMSLEEKISQLTNDSPAIARLDIPAYNWWNECLHGVARAGRATVFPETIGMAATWDTGLIHRVATVISDEARAKHNEFVRRGKRNIYQGLTFWTPNINLFRDPRWGRGMETYGEDPVLTGRMASEFIKGLQGDDPKYLKTIATAKHYAVHSGPESSRHTFDAVIDEADLRDTYLPQFEMAIRDAHAESVMCAYNRVDGLPACANPRLENDILRKQWGFNGYIVSDCGAIGDIYLNHKTSPDAPAGTAAAVKAGTDLNCGVEYAALLPAVKQGLLPESEINTSLRRLLVARFKLGMFDPPAMVKYAQIPYSVNDSPAHGALALETAHKAVVLLKNENHALPLSKSLKTIAVIGPDADDVEVLRGNYNGDPSAPITLLEGLRKKTAGRTKILHARGSDFAANMPLMEPIPTEFLFTTNGADRKSGLTGEYFPYSNWDGKKHQSRELTYPSSGQLVGEIPANPKPLYTQVDAKVDFNWRDGSPRKDLKDDDFGVRWTGFISAPASGTYQIGAFGLNAFDVYVDGKHVAGRNDIHEAAHAYSPVTMEAGKLYPVRVEFHEYVNDAQIKLEWSRPNSGAMAEEALAAAKQADAVVMALGLSPRLEGEEMSVPVEGFSGGDRVSLNIPRVQEDLLQAVMKLGKPTVLVLFNGSAVAVNWAKANVPAIVEAWYPGQAGGQAIADVLFGDYNPGGRLPVTFYQSADQLPPFSDYNMKGRTYRYFTGEPLFPFGYGLSYTTFTYSNLKLPNQMRAGDEAKLSVDVQNTGKMAGEEVVQVYVTQTSRSANSPVRSLAAFERIALKPGEKKTVQLTLPALRFAATGADGRRLAQPGAYEISVGGKQPGFQGLADASTTSVVTGSLQIAGPAKEIN
jgi:beta-glucosidase